jgi:hypothetical protein
MSIARHHAEWLSLVEVSGPFLSMPVLLRVFPQGLDGHDSEQARALREAFEEWQDNQQGLRPDAALHTLWVRFVLEEVLEFPSNTLLIGPAIAEGLKATIAEHGETLRPDLVLQPAGHAPRLLIQVVPPDQDLDTPLKNQRWKASPATRMADLLRGAGVRLGLLTNGERWMLVHAQPGETTGFISWYASLWLEEPLTLRAFRSLLGVHRFFGVPDGETLETLLTESAANQQEVTDQLGYQVREAVEVLVQTLDRIDKDRGRALLTGVSETMLYEAALTVMMRLVFLFSAEERGLLLLGKPMYDEFYAVSTLRAQLRAAADAHGEEVLERRFDAWSRLLATFRAVFGGVQHEDLRLPAYGGALFDPDRFPFLEGRIQGSGVRDQGSETGQSASLNPEPRTLNPRPLPVDNRTVLHLLEALQVLRVSVPGGGPAEPRRLSFRALDIEQIGHVYEGLLDHTAKRAAEPVLGLVGGKDREPEVLLSRLEELAGTAQPKAAVPPLGLFIGEVGNALRDNKALIEFLREKTGRSANALANALSATLEPRDLDALRAACDNDVVLVGRVRPFAGLLRRDSFGRPVVITAGSVYVTTGTDRRTSGTHYTPRSLTEPIVQHTLDPLVYHGPAEGLPKEQWTLHPAERILSLQVCDMAMGSGAFLVQACRYLSERLVEAWEAEGLGFRVQGSGFGVSSSDRKGSVHGSSVVPGSRGLAEGDGTRGGDLSPDEATAEGRDVRPDQSDPAGSSVNPSEHRGGLWAAASQGIHQSFIDSSRLADGSRDPDRADSSAGVSGSGANTNSLVAGTGGRQAAQQSLTFAGSKKRPGSDSLNPGPWTLDPDERLAQARRLVADRCLYGVDKNPLAVEMAKLSLWLITLQKDRPFSFLDHALRAGDSLLGIADIDQLLHWSLAKATGPTTATFLTEPLRRALQRALALRRKIRETPVIDVRDAERKAAWLREAEEALGLVRLAADLLVAAQLHKDKKRREELSAEFQFRMSLAAEAWEATRTDATLRPDANRDALAELRHEADALLDGRTPFHWPLEFPEVFAEGAGVGVQGSGVGVQGSGAEQVSLDAMLAEAETGALDPKPWTLNPGGGFAAIIGNPPFQGGQRITGALGTSYRDYLVETLANGQRGSADLCAYFFLRSAGSLQTNGMAGLIATNTIAQGDTREVGLDQLAAQGFSLPRAVPSRPWPGIAGVEVAHVWLRNGTWQGDYMLDDKPVAAISPFLSAPGATEGNPYRLKANEGKSFQGSIVLGMGFVLEPEEAQALIARDPRNAEALFPYLNGEDLNSRPDQSPSRWVINFQDWPLERAETYPDLMAIVREKVKPERDKNNRAQRRERWWQYAERAPALYATIAGMERVLARSRVANMHSMVFLHVNQVFNERLVVLSSSENKTFAVIQSTIHEEWARNYGSTLKSDMMYSPSDCFETFPFPWEAGMSGISGIGSGIAPNQARNTRHPTP